MSGAIITSGDTVIEVASSTPAATKNEVVGTIVVATDDVAVSKKSKVSEVLVDGRTQALTIEPVNGLKLKSEPPTVTISPMGVRGPRGLPGSGSGAQIFVVDVTNSGTGIVANKEYAPNTVPANVVITDALTDDDTVTIHFMVEGGATYSPEVTVDGIVCTNLTQYSTDRRIFYGSVDITVTTTREVKVLSSDGAEAYVTIHIADPPPSILSCTIVDTPSGQEAVKSGDRFYVIGQAEPTAEMVRVLDSGACNGSGWYSVDLDGAFRIPVSASHASGDQRVTVVAKNNIGSVGDEYISENSVELDQVYPTFTFISLTYPEGQRAFKGVESGAINVNIDHADTYTYSSPTGDFTISDPSEYTEEKVLVFTNNQVYRDNTVNYKIVATRSRNNATSTYTKAIEVANVAPEIVVTQPMARLRPADTYTITVSSNQNLYNTPVLNVPVSGAWISEFSGSGKVYTARISISDGDMPGTGDYELLNTVTNNAGIEATIVGAEVVGGFTRRVLTLSPFGTEVSLPVAVSDVSKLRFSWSFKDGMVFKPVGTTPPVVLGWTIDAINTVPTKVIILDLSAANASSQASSITIEEVV